MTELGTEPGPLDSMASIDYTTTLYRVTLMAQSVLLMFPYRCTSTITLWQGCHPQICRQWDVEDHTHLPYRQGAIRGVICDERRAWEAPPFSSIFVHVVH